MKSKLTSKAQITVPKAIRKQLNLKAGDFVSFEEDGPGKWVFSKVAPRNAACGIGNQFVASERCVDIDGMNAAIETHVAESFRKSTKE